MSMIDGIASLSTAMSQVKLQNEVSTRVLKMAQGQDQITADLLASTMENLEEIVGDMAGSADAGVDAYA